MLRALTTTPNRLTVRWRSAGHGGVGGPGIRERRSRAGGARRGGEGALRG
jgi:hypothetical protein